MRAEEPGVLGRWARWVLAHRRVVAVFWLVLLVAGGASASHVTKRLSYDFSLPGQPGYETAAKVLAAYGTGGTSSPTIAVVALHVGGTVTAAKERADVRAVGTQFEKVAATVADLRIVDALNTRSAGFVTRDGRFTYAYLFGPPPQGFGAPAAISKGEALLSHSLAAIGDTVRYTGVNELATGASSSGPGVLLETLLGGAGALAVLAYVFASFLALVPLLVAVVSIVTTLLVVLGLTYVTGISFVVQFLVSLVGLGVAIDYSLLLVTRWREERAHGLSNEDAVVAAVETAGRAVAISGLTVAIGLVSLLVLPVPFLRSIGIGGVLIPLISVLAVLSLLPALLGGIGPRLDWPRIRHENHASRAWSGWARFVVRFKAPVAAVAAIILAVLLVPLFHLRVGVTSAAAEAKTGAAHAAYTDLVDAGVAPGILTPLEVLTSSASADAVATRLAAVQGMSFVARPTGVAGVRGQLTDLIAVPRVETVDNTTLDVVSDAETALAGRPGYVGLTGLGPIQQDYSRAVYGNFPLMFALIAVLTFLLLARAFRSLVLALKAVVLNLVSLGATFGLLVWFWQDGHGSRAVFSIAPTGAITFWVPLTVFAFLFGLSMDYEVFILSRIREEYDRDGSTASAVVEGLGRTGRLVTSAALILFLAFASLASAPDTDIKVLATGLGAGILLDATVIRGLFVPALVALFGRWNWWLPRGLARLVRVAPSP